MPPHAPMKLTRHLRIVDLALVYKDTLIIGDVQLGYEEALEYEGVLLPRFQLKDILERLDTIFAQVKVKRVIINGDLKHEFGRITNQEWRDALAFFDYLLAKMGKGGEIVVVKGNHDLVLGPVAEKRQIRLVDAYEMDDLTIIHGHKVVPSLRKIVIIGHEHPAISFRERREEKFKCFLVGSWKGKTLIVQPSFQFLTVGSDVTHDHHLSPFLKDGVKNFDVYLVEDGVKFFGKVKDITAL